MLFLEKRINVNRISHVNYNNIFFKQRKSYNTLEKNSNNFEIMPSFSSYLIQEHNQNLTQVPENFMKAFNFDDVTLTF